MNKAQIGVMGLAVAAGAAAFFLFQPAPPPPVPAQVPDAPAPVVSNDVLVAAMRIDFGATITPENVRWQAWPDANPPIEAIARKMKPNAVDEIKGSIVRGQFLRGEPIQADRLVKGPSASMLSTMLDTGKRAMAINIDGSGAMTAGNFILPNDHVDILRTTRDEEASKARGVDIVNTQTILENVKVLAIGQTIQSKNGEAVMAGATATLEVDPDMAEFLTLMQRTGQLSLTLRPIVDAIENGPARQVRPDGPLSVTIIRSGVATAAK